MRKLLTVICFVTTLLLAGIVSAATLTGSLNVTATMESVCTLSASTNVSFGSYIGNTKDVNGQINVLCTPSTSYTISLGTGQSGTYANRAMSNIAMTYLLNYNLYKDLYVTVWGNGTGGSETVTETGDGTLHSTPVIGRVFSGQSVEAGDYSDTVVVTITY